MAGAPDFGPGPGHSFGTEEPSRKTKQERGGQFTYIGLKKKVRGTDSTVHAAQRRRLGTVLSVPRFPSHNFLPRTSLLSRNRCGRGRHRKARCPIRRATRGRWSTNRRRCARGRRVRESGRECPRRRGNWAGRKPG